MLKVLTFIFFLSGLSLLTFSQGVTTITLTDKVVSVSSYTDSEVIIGGQTDLHITASSNPLINSAIKLNSENSWVFFDNIRPDIVISSLLQYIYVNNQAAVQNTNVRIAIYKHGTAVIPHSSSYQPLEVFLGKDFTGSSQKYSMYTFYNSLGGFDNKIRSFKLKRGYMATLATSADGTGYSRVYIADKEDLLVSTLPDLLDNAISFIRVFNWEWVTKKGWAGWNSGDYTKANVTWRYDWNSGGASTSYLEYVPMRPKLNWPSWSSISEKPGVTHVLGLNEPDHPEQHKDDNGEKAITVSQALAQWPDMLKTGLRLGSPGPTDWNWLFAFIDSCKARRYRVDFVAWHAYWVKSPQSWYNDLKTIHDRTGLPIWITEWNNGANWTNETWPDASRALTSNNAQKQLNDLKAILNVLDTAHFVERYAIYNWVQDCRAIVLADTLTPAGKYYAANNSKVAFERVNEVIPAWGGYSNPGLGIQVSGTSNITLTSTDPNGDFNKGYKLEKKLNDGSYALIQDTLGLKTVKYSEVIDVASVKKVRFRMRTMLPDGALSQYSNEIGIDVTEGDSIQYGKISIANFDWNNIFLKNAYEIFPPVVIFGAPTNYNSSVYVSGRVKQVSTTRFTIQLAPWSYQTLPATLNNETAHYLVMKAGKFDFGGLKALANKASVNKTWTNITFSEPFDTIPVVFTTQFTSSTTFATGVRIRNVTKTGFEAKIQKESKVTSALSSETVSFLAITPGKGKIGGKDIIVGKTTGAPVNTTSFSTIEYGTTIANPIFIAQMQTCNDDTVTAALRCPLITTSYARVMKQREKSLGYTAAANEDAGWIIMNPESSTVGVRRIKLTELEIMPNPVADYINFTKPFTGLVKVDIYNIYGTLVKSEIISGDRIDVSDLKAGYYVLKTADNAVVKFVKQ